ncbi:hypothetical protein [Arthrobacter caoxuetaonis]|nr:hypothetical protein [Arthrobacter caoxuetaonis]
MRNDTRASSGTTPTSTPEDRAREARHHVTLPPGAVRRWAAH